MTSTIRKGGEGEDDADKGSARHSVADEADPHGQLRGERTGHHLRESEPFQVLLFRYPAPRHQVPLHVAGKGDGTAEAQCAEAQEIQGKLPQPDRFQTTGIAFGRLFASPCHFIWLG